MAVLARIKRRCTADAGHSKVLVLFVHCQTTDIGGIAPPLLTEKLPIMTDEETDFDESTSEKKPRRTRKRNEERRVFIYRTIDGRPKELGAFPETTIGTPLERRLPVFLKELFGEGDYRMEIRKPNGHFERAFDVSIATEPERAEIGRQNVVEFEPEEDFEQEPEDYSFAGNAGQMNAVEVENLLLKERLKRLEDEVMRSNKGNQSESQTLIAALEESRREQRELMMMMLSQSQKPQQDATTQAMNLLEKSFGMVTKARAISDELAPTETNSNGGYMSEAAKLIDSIGKNAGTFLPLLMNRSAPTAPTSAPRRTKPPTTKGNGQGELSGLLAKVKNKKEGENK